MSRVKTKPSKTADLTAGVRALHLRRVSPPVFQDTLALSLTSAFWRTVIRHRVLTRVVIDGLLGKLQPVTHCVYVRARFGEDQVERLVRAGVSQYVILGAGHDSFAMRRTDLMPQLTVYELDQEATQQEKLRRMAKARIPKPANTHYIAVDLAEQDLMDTLLRAGFQPELPAIFSWFGVTYYLSQEDIQKVLDTIASRAARGSYLMFDYLSDPDCTPAQWRPLQQDTGQFVAKRGEPWISSFDPARVAARLQEAGFEMVEHLPPNAVQARYLQDHPAGTYPEVFGMCCAQT